MQDLERNLYNVTALITVSFYCLDNTFCGLTLRCDRLKYLSSDNTNIPDFILSSMPYVILKLGKQYVQGRNKDTGKIKAKKTTIEKAKKQIKLLNILDHKKNNYL